MKRVIKKLSELAQFVEVDEGLLNILNGCTVKIHENEVMKPPRNLMARGSDNEKVISQPFKKALQLTWHPEVSKSAGRIFIIRDLQVEKFVTTMIYQSEQLVSQ